MEAARVKNNFGSSKNYYAYCHAFKSFNINLDVIVGRLVIIAGVFFIAVNIFEWANLISVKPEFFKIILIKNGCNKQPFFNFNKGWNSRALNLIFILILRPLK